MKALLKIIGVAALAGAFVHIMMNWSVMPEQVPQHYNSLGEVDAWAAKPFIFFPPAIGVVLWLLTELAQRFPMMIHMMDDKSARNKRQIESAKWMMVCLQFELALLFTYLSVKDVYVAKGQSFGLQTMEMPIILFIIFGTAIGFTIYSFTQKSIS